MLKARSNTDLLEGMAMKKVLYIDACMRARSRTAELAAAYIRQVFPENDCSVQKIRVADLDIAPLIGEDVAARDADLAAGRTDLPAYALARKFAAADEIVIAAPFWDSSFPSKLKVYIEHICVQSLTFGYGADGRPAKICKADRLTYITTAGGPLRESPAVKLYWEELCGMFGIEDLRFYCAEGLDANPAAAARTLQRTLDAMLADRARPAKKAAPAG